MTKIEIGITLKTDLTLHSEECKKKKKKRKGVAK
jgi:hypothetical protein